MNEKRAFSKPEIEKLFSQFVLLRLHTDKVPTGVVQVPDAAGSKQLEKEKFDNRALPYYEVVLPDGKRLDPPHFYAAGLIREVDDFARFLQDALDAAKKG